MTLTLPIPSMRPLLVSHEKITPYLLQIDTNRYYSNRGPLVQEYESRLSKMFKANVVSTASCTSALTCALLALNLPRGSKCLVQSWTFVGTVAAIVAAGLEPVFADVDLSCWNLSADLAFSYAESYPEIKAVVAVSAFGARIDRNAWEKFQAETDIPVVIDAAGCFDSLEVVGWGGFKVPVCVSTHATKVFSTGEGGFVVTADNWFAEKFKQITNYGYCPDRTIPFPGINAKMSEYHAAVGLAELDWWPEKRQMWLDAHWRYDKAFGSLLSTCVRSLSPIALGRKHAPSVIDKLASNGITARKIWGDGCHAHESYKHYHRFDLTNTKRLANEIITLPFAIDMTGEEIDYIHAKFAEVTG